MLRAYIFVETKPGTSLEVVKRIKSKVREVVQADAIYGRFDVIIMLETPDFETLHNILYNVIEKDPDIVHTETSLVLREIE
ncbi:MAG: Lrp/AsnC ligand binding domain-containing protein [Candidatus Bathyarchaeia archaeon]|nr:Lrp/AsnC ligand binding domain-containing protein [Candidatus Bathyarchaeota archaeon]